MEKMVKNRRAGQKLQKTQKTVFFMGKKEKNKNEK